MWFIMCGVTLLIRKFPTEESPSVVPVIAGTRVAPGTDKKASIAGRRHLTIALRFDSLVLPIGERLIEIDVRHAIAIVLRALTLQPRH